ncbi:MAG: hypothetical protein EOO61_01420 [Hymenobacter sp.]|nr:MAG: hypothetical protein EOO61_01420 [Hymenobacter sp.]
MDSTDRLWAYGWTLLAATFVIIALSFYYNNQTWYPLDARVRIECIKHGGTWGPMPGTDTENTCDMRK